MNKRKYLQRISSHARGVDVAKCTILQKPLQSRRKLKATCGSISETSSNIHVDSNFVNSARFAAKNPVQKRKSPIGVPRMSRCGTCEAFITGGNMEISLRLNSSHLDILMKISSGGPRSSIMESGPQNSLSGASQHPIIQVPCLKDETKVVIICIDGGNDLV